MTFSATGFTRIFERRSSEDQPAWLIYIGTLSVIIYAISRTGFPKVAEITSSIAVLIGLWGLFKYGKIVNSHILLRFLWIGIILQLISWGLAQYITPEWAESTPRLSNLNGWFLFIPFAWLIAQKKNAIWLIWGAAALGVLLSPWITGEGFDELIRGINGSRVDFKLLNAQHMALFFGSVFIGLCCFSKTLYKRNTLLIIPLALLIYYTLLVVYISQTRQAWISLAITLTTMSIFLIIKYIKKQSTKKQISAILLFIITLVILSTLALNNDKIKDRFMAEKDSISAITSLNFDDVPYSSFGIRFHSWVAATDFIKEKPLFGWGNNGKSLVMEHTEWLPKNIKDNFGHLHNTYLELLVNYGVLGLLFYFSVWFIIGKMLFKEIKQGNIEKEFGYMYISIFIFWSIMNCFESYQNFWTGEFYFNIFMAGILSKVWRIKSLEKYKNI
ncbi:O-antigen ligase family protein [Marinomonas sp. M1K-6]|uniref:O-antigen ligase family protein n=1 Tax=Marinomonas profundi TaxID=2726122 RepID=A0A847R4Z1_9GAMM|nr:O-antigen ligase family protein [Marinomonas profundi]NLQ19082.1 O-antigen ligase family protein [Marinomonas profundi]UDV04226.1 O-antigen ligase family protein [Marinomonas profundi]